MKKLTVLVLTMALVLAVGSMASAQTLWQNGSGVIKMGVDFNGEFDYDDDGDEDVDSGISLSGEYLFQQQANADFGLGVTYQFDRQTEDRKDDFNFIPVYGVIKLTPEMGNQYQPYFVGQLGYNFFNADVDNIDTDNGMYYGVGAGFKANDQVDVELLYTVNNGEIDPDGEDAFDVEYSKLRLGVSLSF